MGRPPSGWSTNWVPLAAQAQAISSATRARARQPRSLPPQASGTQMPNRPASLIASIASEG